MHSVWPLASDRAIPSGFKGEDEDTAWEEGLWWQPVPREPRTVESLASKGLACDLSTL